MIKCALDGGASLDDITDALNVFNGSEGSSASFG